MTGYRRVVPALVLIFFMAPAVMAQNSDPGSDRDAMALQTRIEALEKEIEWTRRQRQELSAYVERQEKDLDQLERRCEELRRFQMELMPYLAATVDRLDRFIQDDLPFLPEERARRVAVVQDSLTDYHLDSGEKLRRVMEALRVEAGYGRDVEAGEAEILLDGRPVQVHLLRLGRIGLFFRTADGIEMGYRTKTSDGWTPLPARYGRSLKKAFELAQGRRAAELVTLPVGAIQE